MTTWNIGEIKAKATSLDTQMKKALDGLEKARDLENDAKIKFEEKKREVEVEQRDLLLSLKQAYAGETDMWLDPVSGEFTEEWALRVLQQMVDNDEVYKGRMEDFLAAQNSLYRKQSKVLNLTESLGALKVRMRMVSALLIAASEDSD